MYRARIEVPANSPDDAIVKALHGLTTALGVKPADLSEATSAPPDSYSLTIHVFPNKKKE
jgi:hypothetical protein